MEVKSSKTELNLIKNHIDIEIPPDVNMNASEPEIRKALVEIILDMSWSNYVRMKHLNIFIQKWPNHEQLVEIINKLSLMFQFSGIKRLEKYLYSIVTESKMSPVLKISPIKSLCTFRDRQTGFKALNIFCKKMSKDIPTPCQIEIVKILMEKKEYKKQALGYFINIINNQSIACDYRYKSILSLENLENVKNKKILIKHATLSFFNNSLNRTLYRILAGQMLMQKKLVPFKNERNHVQLTIMSFAQDPELDYNLRADAADVILGLGDLSNKLTARKIIQMLGRENRSVRTIFDNAQNVHVDEIEKSVKEIIEFLSSIVIRPSDKEDKKEITFDVIKKNIKDLLEIELKQKIKEIKEIKAPRKTGEEIYFESVNSKEDPNYVSKENKKNKEIKEKQITDSHEEKVDKINISLNRILIDRALYSQYNCSLLYILKRIWIYLSSHKNRKSMELRLLQELVDMSGTCSSGFASRLVNVISGFGEFSLRISWRDQLVSNFTGRLNSRARKMAEKDQLIKNYNIYCKKKREKQIETYKNYIKNIESTGFNSCQNKKDSHITKFRSKYINDKKENKLKALTSFQSKVIQEMCLNTNDFASRRNFLKFFRKNMLSIREELYEEFKDYIDDTSFDLYFRAAVSMYETGGYV
jgi:hypothetical protein